jgi:hypothetical protein
MTKTKKTARKGKRSINIAKLAVGANAIFQMVEPFVSAGAIEAARNKDVAGFIAAIKAGSKEAVSIANMLEAAGPAVVLAIATKVAKMTGAPRPHIGNVHAY